MLDQSVSPDAVQGGVGGEVEESDTLFDEDELIEVVWIDGMCGVY